MEHLPIVVSVDGGLGDHVSAEPSIRYLQKIYPAPISITCAYPRVFAHLNIPTHPHNTFRLEDENKTYKKLLSFPRTGPITQSVSFLVTHAVDYHAMAMLHRTLPLLDKTYLLGVEQDDVKTLRKKLAGHDPKKLILIHASKGWRSKTFPKEWWQETAGALTHAGLQIALIGKRTSSLTGDQTGVVEIACPPGALDLRDALSLGELFALVSLAPVLLGNDSSLIQIAGAFDNWIVLIPSCKHPDFVLPYRHGTPYYKAKALAKKLALDDQAFEPVRDGAIFVDFPVPDWSLYLPEPNQIAIEIRAIQ